MFTSEEIPASPHRVGAFTGKQIQEARAEKGWTQKQLAQRCNLKPAVVQQYEAGNCVMEPATLGKIKRALGIQRIRKKPKSRVRKQQESWDREMSELGRELYPEDYTHTPDW